MPPSGFFFPLAVQKEARKVPVGGTRINPAAGLDKRESFSAWQREHETNGSESEKQGESESERQRRARASRSPAVSARPREKREESFREGEGVTSEPKEGSGSPRCCSVPAF